MKFCPHCGNKIPNNATFCDKCGKPVTNSQPKVPGNMPSNNHKNLFLTLIIIALIVVIGAGVYLFTSGATKQVSTKQPSATTSKAKDKEQSTSSKAQTTKTTSKKSSSNDDKAVWNSSKNTKLNNFMVAFGSNMNQDYNYFNPANQDNYMGYRFPEVLSKGNVRVNGSPVSIGWSDDGTGSNDYNVVAIYSDFDSDRHKGNTVSPHLYLFTIHDGQPVALVTQQNQGNDENAIYFKPTANQDVSSQFANIVNNNQMNY